MGSWLVKALAQRAIGALPNPHYWNELFQDRVTHSLELTEERFEAGLRNCRSHLEQLRRFGPAATSDGFSAFELGTGWFPTVPLGLFLCGAQEVWTWDVAPLLRRDRLEGTIRRFLEFEEEERLEVEAIGGGGGGEGEEVISRGGGGAGGGGWGRGRGG